MEDTDDYPGEQGEECRENRNARSVNAAVRRSLQVEVEEKRGMQRLGYHVLYNDLVN